MIAGCDGVELALGSHARRAESGSGDAPGKVHRIGEAQVAAIALPALEAVMSAEAYAERSR